MPETTAVAAQIPRVLTQHDLAKLAREVAMNIRELPDILKIFNISIEHYERLKLVPFFKYALETSIIEWNSALTTHERIKIEAAATLEEAMPKLGARMMKDDEALPAAIEAGKLFAKIAGIGEANNKEQASAEKFTITINLGGDEKIKFEKDVTPRAESGSAATILENAEGARNAAAGQLALSDDDQSPDSGSAIQLIAKGRRKKTVL